MSIKRMLDRFERAARAAAVTVDNAREEKEKRQERAKIEQHVKLLEETLRAERARRKSVQRACQKASWEEGRS